MALIEGERECQNCALGTEKQRSVWMNEILRKIRLHREYHQLVQELQITASESR